MFWIFLALNCLLADYFESGLAMFFGGFCYNMQAVITRKNKSFISCFCFLPLFLFVFVYFFVGLWFVFSGRGLCILCVWVYFAFCGVGVLSVDGECVSFEFDLC